MLFHNRPLLSYAAAILAPLAATPIAFLVDMLLPGSNRSLVYLTALLIVAVATSIRPALLCAVTSFLAFDYFMSEPHFSLTELHRHNIPTIGFFLLLAAVTGHLTSRLRQQVMALQAREHINQAQIELSKQLLTAIHKKDVVNILCHILRDMGVCRRCFAVEVDRYGGIEFLTEPEMLTTADEKAIRSAAKTFMPAGKFTDERTDTGCYSVPLSDGRSIVAVIGMSFREDATPVEDKLNIVRLILHQTSLALGRTQLVADLQRERLEKEQELLRSALLSSVSHDLRTPLAAMIGATTSLLDLEESLDREQKHELLESVLQESQRLDRYIQNLLDMTRLGRADLELDRDWTAFEDMLSLVLKRVRPLLRGHTIQTEIEPDLPLLYVNAALIEQVMFNVLENAVKFSPDASPLTISVRRKNGSVIIDIADCGPGIPAQERERIFDMFYTVRRGDRHAAGTGLGLTITHGVVSAHGGTVEVLDGPDGVGTVMRITLPADEQQSLKGAGNAEDTGN
ncbi:MAG TPA: ATP-binding protein [Gammaproteobacteria bacterium]|nr:ATP-binding protein [Gammaproteobacteria bacterium]